MPGGIFLHVVTISGSEDRGPLLRTFSRGRKANVMNVFTQVRSAPLAGSQSANVRWETFTAFFIVIHVFVWTIVPLIVRSQSGLWDDMLETYAWSQEWQLGYYKHPPFYSWVVGVWFLIFPRAEWAYYLLSAANVGVGLAGMWALAGRFVKGEARVLSVLMLAFMPYYSYMASNFNANTMLLSLWPWTVYFFVRSLETRSVWAGAAFGALGAAALLSKYYSILLLVSCFGSSLLHPAARRYYTSPAPYVAVATAAVLCLPHVWWSVQNDFPTIRYAMGKTGQPWFYNFRKAITTALASLAMNGIGLAVLAFCLRRRGGDTEQVPVSGSTHPLLENWKALVARENWWFLAAAAGPFLITIVVGAAGYIKIAVNFLIPTFFMLPLLVMIVLQPAVSRVTVRGVTRVLGLLFAVALLVSPAISYATLRAHVKGTISVSPLTAADAAQEWRKAFGVPVRIVSGTELHSLAQVFYTSERPSEFTHFTFEQAPWITPQRIAREGLLTVCKADDEDCLANARRYANARTIEKPVVQQRRAYGLLGKPRPFIYVMTPPATPDGSSQEKR